MQVRVDQLVPYGYTDTAISTFHAFGDRLIREYALELGPAVRPAGPVAAGDGHLPARAAVPAGAGRVPARSGDPTRFLDALATLFSPAQGRGRRAGRVPRPTRRRSRRTPRRPATTPAREARREEARRQVELAAAYGRYQELLGEAGAIDFGDQVASRCGSCASHRPPGAELQAPLPVRARGRVPGRQPGPGGARRAARRAAPQRDRGGRRRPVDLPLPRRRHRRHPRLPGPLPGRPDVVLRRNYRSRAPILDAAYRLIRFNDPDRLEVRTGIAKRLVAARAGGRAIRARSATSPSRPAPRRRTGSPARSPARIADRGRAARPRDPRPRERRRGPDPAQPQPGRRSPGGSRASSGLYARPEVRLLLAFLRAVADPDSSVDVYALAASELYGLGGRGPRGPREPGAPANRSPVGDARGAGRASRGSSACSPRPGRRWRGSSPTCAATPSSATSARPARSSTTFLRGSGCSRGSRRRSRAGRRGGALEHRPLLRHRPGPVRLLADDRAVFLAPHLQTLIEAGDDPATADLDPDADAVAVIDRAQGEGPRVAGRLPAGLVDGRFPARGRREPLAVPDALLRGIAARGRRPRPGGAAALLRGHDPRPRRAGPVARRSTTAGSGRGASRRSCSRRWTCRPGRAPAPRASTGPARAAGRLRGRRPEPAPAARDGRPATTSRSSSPSTRSTTT